MSTAPALPGPGEWPETEVAFDAARESTAAVTPPHVARPLRLEPFAALRLAASRIGDPGAGRTFSRPHHDVERRLAAWQERGLLTQDRTPGLYVHEYTGAGTTIRGLVGSLDVSRRALRSADRAVLPHEGIYPAQADELADRMAEMSLNPAPILLVQRSPARLRQLLRTVRTAVPEHQFVDRHGESHRLWTIRDPAVHSDIADALADTTALIADGHHRYAAYLRLQQREHRPETSSGLAMLVDQDDTPLRLGAIHRVLMGTSFADTVAAAELIGFRVDQVSRERALAAQADRTVVATDSTGWALLTVAVDEERSAVEVVHEHLVPALAHGPSGIEYHHSVTTALQHAGPATALLLPPPALDRVLHVAMQDRLLPQKATSFQPKPPFGVLLRSLRER